jgi:ABC-type sugar transport system permease subunit
MIAWPVLQFCVFYIGVNLNSILLAFKDFGNSQTDYTINFDNFKVWLDFDDSTFGAVIPDAFKVSIKAYLISLVVGVPLGLFFSYYIFKKLPLSGFFRVILFLPTIVSSIVLVFMYRLFANNILTEILSDLGLRSGDPLLDTKEDRFATMMVYNVFVSFGTSVLMYSNKMATLSPEVIESAQLDGAGAFKEFFYVVLPMVFSTISVFLITGVAGIFTNQINSFAFFPHKLSGYPETNTLGYILYYRTKKAGQNDWEYPPLAALGLLLTLVAFPLTLFARYMLNHFGPSED